MRGFYKGRCRKMLGSEYTYTYMNTYTHMYVYIYI